MFKESAGSPGEPRPLELAIQFCKEPGNAMRRLLDYDVTFFHWPLIGIFCGATLLPVILVGMIVGPLLSSMVSPEIGGLVLLAIPASVVLLLASIYGFAGLLWLTGRPLGGQASYRELVAATLWALVPLIPGALLGAVPLLGEIASLVALLYAASIMVVTVAEAQQFSNGMSMVNQTLAFLIIALVLVAVLYQPAVSLIQQLQQATGGYGF